MATHPGTALVTGASSGIGEIYADRLARRGHDLILVGRSAERLDALAAKLAASGVSATTLVGDLANPADLAQVEARLANDPAISLLVNSAGLIGGGPLSSGDIDAMTAMLAVNVTALSRLSAVAAKAFAGRGKGAIINLSSATAFIDNAGASAYAASKAYVLNLTLSLDLDLKPQGVQVQAVLPGYTQTPMIGAIPGIPPEYVMSADDMVDAALVGFDRGELVTIPSMEATGAYDAWAEKRQALLPHLSLDKPAPRYLAAKSVAA